MTEKSTEGSGVLVSVCCWCRRVYGEKSAEGAESGVSHGLCGSCFEFLMKEEAA